MERFDSVRLPSAVTPTVARSIVRTDSREFRYLRLDQRPFDGTHSTTAFQDDCGAALTGTQKMQPITTHVNKPARSREARALHRCHDTLIYCRDQEKCEHKRDQHQTDPGQ